MVVIICLAQDGPKIAKDYVMENLCFAVLHDQVIIFCKRMSIWIMLQRCQLILFNNHDDIKYSKTTVSFHDGNGALEEHMFISSQYLNSLDEK